MSLRNQIATKLRSGGFRFPREHGLTSIWVGAVGLGIGMSLYSSIDFVGLILSLTFATSILFSSDSLLMQIKRKPEELPWIPLLTISVTALAMIIWNQTLELLIVFGVMGVLTVGYLIVSMQSKKQTPTDLTLGSVSMGFLATCIYLVIVGEVTIHNFIEILVINIAFIGVSIIHILYVETLKEKISIRNFLFSWIVIVGIFLIPLTLQIVGVVIFIPLVEPTVLVLMQVYRKEKIKESKRNIKIIGLQLMFRLWMVVILLLVFYRLILPISPI
ncbi:MAG: hypothetical protein ACW98I_19730 [Candidatus Hodarchaeales archaeon]